MKGFKGLITVLKTKEKKIISTKEIEKNKLPIKFSGLMSY
jgi:hypothetical protein